MGAWYCRRLLDNTGDLILNCSNESVWSMSSDIFFLMQIWYFQFFISMGGVLSAAVPLTIGVLLTHWLYLCARKIESKPTPSSFPKTILRLSGFQALVAGAVLVPFCTIGLFYLLIDLMWKFAPAMPPPPYRCPVYKCASYGFRFSSSR